MTLQPSGEVEYIVQIRKEGARELRRLEVKHWLWRIRFYGGLFLAACALLVVMGYAGAP